MHVLRKPNLIESFGALLFAGSAWLFIELADDAPEGDYLDYERTMMLWFRHGHDLTDPLGPAWLQYAAMDLTALGGAPVLLLVTLGVVGFLFMQGKRVGALLTATAIFSGWGLAHALKEVFARERPDFVPHLVEVSTMAFPSGHSMMSAVVYLTLGAMAARQTKRKRERAFVLGCACLLVLIIGVTRLFLGVHFPTDVLAGWSLGLSWALLWLAISEWISRRAVSVAGMP
jgi:undecaprenyl-diphosphatase